MCVCLYIYAFVYLYCLSDSVTWTMAEASTSSNCHLCNGPLKNQCILSFDCSHQLCPTCVQLAEGRSVCPTCSPASPPIAAGTNKNFQIFNRMVSYNTEQAPPKFSPTSKTIDADEFKPSKNSSSRLAIPSSSHHSSSSTSSSPSSSRQLSPTGRASSDSCIAAAQIDYTESVEYPALCHQSNQYPGALTRQVGHRLQVETETRRHPEILLDDGRGGTGSARRDLVDYVRALKEHSEAFRGKLDETGVNEAVFVEKIAAVEREVKRQARERRMAIDRAENELLMKLEARKKELMLESEAVRRDTELRIEELNSLRKTLEEAVKERDDDGSLDQVLFHVQGDVCRALERRVATVCFGSISFIYTPENFIEAEEKNIIGEIEFPPNKNRGERVFLVLSEAIFLSPRSLTTSVLFFITA